MSQSKFQRELQRAAQDMNVQLRRVHSGATNGHLKFEITFAGVTKKMTTSNSPTDPDIAARNAIREMKRRKQEIIDAQKEARQDHSTPVEHQGRAARRAVRR